MTRTTQARTESQSGLLRHVQSTRMAGNPPTLYPPSPNLLIDTNAIREHQEGSIPIGPAGPPIGIRSTQEVVAAIAWNEVVSVGMIIRNSEGEPISAILQEPPVREALQVSGFRTLFWGGYDQQLREIEMREGFEVIASILMALMEIVSLTMTLSALRTARIVPARTGGLSPQGIGSTLRSWVRRRLSMVGELIQGIRQRAASPREVTQRLVRLMRRNGQPVVVNIGEESSAREIEAWGAIAEAAINVNPLTSARPQQVPNLVRIGEEEIGSIFEAGQVDQIISNRLPPNTLDWDRLIPGAHRILKSGGRISTRFQGTGSDAAVIVSQMRALGFREVRNYLGAAIEAIE